MNLLQLIDALEYHPDCGCEHCKTNGMIKREVTKSTTSSMSLGFADVIEESFADLRTINSPIGTGEATSELLDMAMRDTYHRVSNSMDSKLTALMLRRYAVLCLLKADRITHD